MNSRNLIINDIWQFSIALQARKPILGLDLGEKTIGIAISDITRSIATGLTTLRRQKFLSDAQKLRALALDRQVVGIILGLPINMNGSEGPRAQSTRSFAKNLSKIIELPISFWDERLSSSAAEQVLLEADSSRKTRSKVIDYVAATYILQGALDRMQNQRRENYNDR